MNRDLLPPLAISSWSLHRALGLTFPNRPDHDVVPDAEATYGLGDMTLLDLPAAVAALDVDRAELCSFHVPTRHAGYLEEVKAAFSASGVRLQTLLVEYGDITDPATAARDLDWIESWIAAAAVMGAEQARIIAGKAKASPETLQLSAAGLNRLGKFGAERGVRIVTENWFDLLANPADVRYLFDRLEGNVQLNGDFGNWSGPEKYADLQAIFDLAVCCHAKGDFSSGALDAEDYRRCLEAAEAAGFDGPYTLIYDGPDDDERAHLAVERDFIRSHFAARRAAA